MPIFSLLVLAVIVIVLLVLAAIGFVIGQMIWSAFISGVIHWLRPEGERTKWIVLLSAIFPVLYLIALFVVAFWAWPDEQDAYWAAFGIEPSPTTTIHSGVADGWADYLDIELYFTASPADVQAITSKGLTIDQNFQATSWTQGVPVLYGIPLTEKDIYTGESPHQDFASESAILIHDPQTGEVWYWFEGVD